MIQTARVVVQIVAEDLHRQAQLDVCVTESASLDARLDGRMSTVIQVGSVIYYIIITRRSLCLNCRKLQCSCQTCKERFSDVLSGT